MDSKTKWKNYLKHTKLQDGKYVVFDIEASGGNPQKNGLTEICALKIDNDKIIDKFYTMVNPEVRIPPIVRKMTGITHNMVKDAPKANEVMPDFLEFIEGHILVSHNTQGDLKFLNYFAEKHCGSGIENFFICTHLLSEKLIPQAKDKSLTGMSHFFEIAVDDEHHRADVDAKLTLELFFKLRSLLESKGIEFLEDAVRKQQDLESGIRLGWQISRDQLRDAPKKCGVIRFYDANDNLVFIISSQFMNQDIKKLANFRSLPKRIARELLKSHKVSYEATPHLIEAYQMEAREESIHNLSAKADSIHGRVTSTINFDQDPEGTRVFLGSTSSQTKLAFGQIRDRKEAQQSVKQWVTEAAIKSKRKGYVLPGVAPEFIEKILEQGLEKESQNLSKPTWKTMIFAKAKHTKQRKLEYLNSLKNHHSNFDSILSQFSSRYLNFFSLNGLLLAGSSEFTGKSVYPVISGAILVSFKFEVQHGLEQLLSDTEQVKSLLKHLERLKKEHRNQKTSTSKSDLWILDGCLPDQFFYGCRFLLESTLIKTLNS